LEIYQRKPVFIGYVSVSEKSNIGDAVITDEKLVLRQVVFHDLERGPAAIAFRCEESGFSE
jgi:hypothetical protein